ncbi:MAG TPA: hypothetical protein VHG32_10820 [Thermoanaerobaculia bacterium]|jgi:hypothetical protein|nr:hypothetical protein [Thermoanaerobaculia bacterium]
MNARDLEARLAALGYRLEPAERGTAIYNDGVTEGSGDTSRSASQFVFGAANGTPENRGTRPRRIAINGFALPGAYFGAGIGVALDLLAGAVGG